MKHFAWMIIALLLLGSVPALAGDVPLEKIVNALERPFKSDADTPSDISDFRADFYQRSRLASLDREQEGAGKVALEFDSTSSDASRTKFRWDYEKPTEQLIVSDGKTLWVYVPENRQAIRTEVSQEEDRPEDPLTFLAGLGNLSRDFTISWADPARDEAGNSILELRPKKPSPLLERLQVVVNRKAVGKKKVRGTFPILSTTVYDPSGNTTRIEFRNVKTNVGIPEGEFQFTPPEGIEVVRPSKDSPGLY